MAAPVTAGMIAIANQIRLLNSKTQLSSINNTNNIQTFLYKSIYNNNLDYKPTYSELKFIIDDMINTCNLNYLEDTKELLKNVKKEHYIRFGRAHV